MTEATINPLRRRMLEDMTVRNLSEGTQRVDIGSVRGCCRYCNKKPGELTFEDVRTFRLQLVESGLAPGSVNGAMVGLRFFFRVTLGGEHGAEPVHPEPDCFVTYVDATLVEQVLDVAQRQGVLDVHQYHQPDHLRRAVEPSEWVGRRATARHDPP